jgi:hypothetical protein
MSAAREAFVLPLLFLTVVLIGGVRPGAAVVIVPPSLASLITAMVLFALLVRSGALDPNRLLHTARSPLANLNGMTVLMTAFVASAQVITMLVPESGVPALITWLVIAALLIQALALGPDRDRVLRGLMVTFGAAFTLKFIVLAAISTPADGRFARALQLLFEGVTLGGVTQRPPHVTEGYLAFATVLLYLVGVALLPSASWHMARIARGELTSAPGSHAQTDIARHL